MDVYLIINSLSIFKIKLKFGLIRAQSLVAILALFLLPVFIYSQSDYNKKSFRLYKMSDGLASAVTKSIQQDKLGYIWISSQGGISRFDGLSFTNFDKRSDLLTLREDAVNNSVRLNDTLLAFNTPEGSLVVNAINMTSLMLIIPDTTGFYQALNNVSDIVLLSNGNFLVLTRTGLYEFDNNGKVVFSKVYITPFEAKAKRYIVTHEMERKELIRFKENKIAVYAFGKVQIYDPYKHVMLEDEVLATFAKFSGNNNIRKCLNKELIAFVNINADSIFCFNSTNNTIKGQKLPFNGDSEFYQSTKILPIGENEYVILSWKGGFYTFKIVNNDIVFNNTKYLAAHFCTYVIKDKDGRLWVTTNNGVLKEENYNSIFKVYPVNQHEDYGVPFSNILSYKDKIVVTVANAKNNVKILDARTKKILFQTFLEGTQYTWPVPFRTKVYHEDTVWISTNAGIYWMSLNTYQYGKVKMPLELNNITLRMAPVNKDGLVWMCGIHEPYYLCYNTINRKFIIYTDTSSGRPQQSKAVNLTYDSYGDVWFYGYGLQRWNSRKKTFDTLIIDFGKKGLYINFFEYVYPDTKGFLWIRLKDDKFIKYEIKTGVAENVDMNQYVQMRAITSWPQDVVDDIMWIGNSNAIIAHNLANKETVIYGVNEGLPDENFTSRAVYCELTGECLIFVGQSIMSFPYKPYKWPRKKISIDFVKGGDRLTVFNPGDTVYFKHDQNTVTIKFNVLDFNIKQKVKFNYRIDEDTMWNCIAQDQPIFLYNLSYGWHKVTIQSIENRDKFFPKQLYLYIKPPYWRTLWFTLFVVFCFIILVISITLYFFRRAKRENNLQLQLKEFEIKALHAQMNPHFIFNCLNSIKSLIINEKNKEASKYINGFSKLVRLNLDHSRKPFITLKENIEYIELYLKSEQLRFTNFEYQLEIDDNLDVDHFMVIPMLVQPIVENAIWHGLQSVTSERILKVFFQRDNSGAKCIIDDNGIGIKASLQKKTSNSKTSVGMNNVRERLALFNRKYGLDYRIEVLDKSEISSTEQGTRVIIYFNKIENYD